MQPDDRDNNEDEYLDEEEAALYEKWREWIEPAPPGCSWRRYIVGGIKRVIFMGFMHDMIFGGRK